MFKRPRTINGNTIFVPSMSGGFNDDLLPFICDIESTDEPANDPDNQPVDDDGNHSTNQQQAKHC